MEAYKKIINQLKQKQFVDRYPDYDPGDGKVHVLYFCPYVNGVGLYRSFMPAVEMNKTTTHSAIIMYALDWSQGMNGWDQEIPLEPLLIDWAHYIIFPTSVSDLRPWIKEIRNLNPDIRILMDVDDNIHQIPAIHPGRSIYNKDALAWFDFNREKVFNGIIFATPALHAYYGNNGNDVVWPNLMSIDLFDKNPASLLLPPDQDSHDKKIRIGMALNGGHYLSAKAFRPVLHKLGKMQQVELVNLGWDGKLGNYPNPFDKIKMQFASGVPFPEYFTQLASLNLDIALIPLNDTAFNQYKSPQKFFEYAVTGVPVIAPERSVYQDVIQDEYNGLLTKNWFDDIVYLTSVPTMREELRANAFKEVWTSYAYNDVRRRQLTELFTKI